MLQGGPWTVKKAVFVTVPGLQRTMSGREDAPKVLIVRCARDTQLTRLFFGQALTGRNRACSHPFRNSGQNSANEGCSPIVLSIA